MHMRVRDTWLLDEHYFDEPNDWSVSPELKPLLRDEVPESIGIRSLLEDSDDRWHDEGSDR
jgi:hypothetical protein